MKKFIGLVALLFSILIGAQNIKVTYVCNNSGETDHIERVYLNNGYKISVADSTVIKKYGQRERAGTLSVVSRDKIYRRVIIADTKTKNVYFTYAFNNKNYLVSDVVPPIKWKIDAKSTKKIGKYTCQKATTTYRGTDMEAWFTNEIPVSLAPNKISGLPGLVMEMRSIGLLYNIWTVQSIEFPYKGSINYSPKYIKSLPSITVKDLVAKIDAKIEEEENIEQSKLKFPDGVELVSVVVERFNARDMLETKFEWEK